jgi:hypothetical protein
MRHSQKKIKRNNAGLEAGIEVIERYEHPIYLDFAENKTI